jgi:hypothetical protein
MNTASFIQGFP